MEAHTKKDQYMLRLPSGWRDAVKVEAQKEQRSMNAEILMAIQTAMRLKGVNLDTGA